MFSPPKRRYRKNPLIVDQSERLRELLDIRGPHSRATVPPPGAGVRFEPIERDPVKRAPVNVAGRLARRTGLFVVAYAPLAVLFLAATWPAGWTTADLLPVALWLVALATVAAFPVTAAFVPRGRPRGAVAAGTVLAAGAVAIGAQGDLLAPLAADPAGAGTSALAAGVAFGFCVVAVELVALMALIARGRSTTSWRVRNPGDPTGFGVDYAFTYVFPICIVWFAHTSGGWIGPAVTLYLLFVFVTFVVSTKFVLISPVLRLLGFRLYDVVLQSSEVGPTRVVLISRNALAHHGHVKAVRLGPDCFVGRRVAAPYAPSR